MYQKCVCFIFLVILAVLNCYGFRIDNLAMTDLTKKNFHTSPNTYYSNTDKYIRADTVNRPHRIRHHRLWRTQAHNRYPKPLHIDPMMYPLPVSKSISSTNDKLIWPYKSSIESSESANMWPLADSSRSELKSTSSEVELSHIEPASSSLKRSQISEVPRPTRRSSEVLWPAQRFLSEVSPPEPARESNASLTYPTIFPDENLAQIPPTDFTPVKFVVSRSQRSSNHRPERRKNRWSPRQNEDVFAKAYRAEYVILAEVESRNINETNEYCEYYVKVIKDFKGNVQKVFWMLYKSYRGLLKANCDLVKDMKNSKKYLLLLDKNLLPIDAPKPRVRPGMTKKLKRACKAGFEPTKPHIAELREVPPKSRKKVERRNRILICKAKGFPPPKITWRRRNEVLHHSSSSYNILYKRRQSKLIIKKPDAVYLGQYECIAENIKGERASKNVTLLPPQPSKECPFEYHIAFCQNGGKCVYEQTMGIPYCICPENYSGEKCEVKKPSNTSMYPQPDLYTCKLGLSTKYNC